jgi:hypothetical protein
VHTVVSPDLDGYSVQGTKIQDMFHDMFHGMFVYYSSPDLDGYQGNTNETSTLRDPHALDTKVFIGSQN